jgi:hypothetical protein
MEINEMTKYSIELDCPPGNPRPNDLIDGVLEGTGLDLSDFSTSHPFFGHQAWILKAGPEREEKFELARKTFKQRVSDLYDANVIRYGSW